MRIDFRPVTTSRKRAGKCPVCGKSATRQQTFEHTVNPFNRNADGTVKDYDQVRADVTAEANAWIPDFTHAHCA